MIDWPILVECNELQEERIYRNFSVTANIRLTLGAQQSMIPKAWFGSRWGTVGTF